MPREILLYTNLRSSQHTWGYLLHVSSYTQILPFSPLTSPSSTLKGVRLGSYSSPLGSMLIGDWRRPSEHMAHSGFITPQNCGPVKGYLELCIIERPKYIHIGIVTDYYVFTYRMSQKTNFIEKLKAETGFIRKINYYYFYFWFSLIYSNIPPRA